MGFRVRIYYEDTDSGGIVYHSNYIKFCERARSEIVFNSGIEFTQSRHFVVTKLEASYIKPAVLGDILEVKTKLIKVGGASLTLAQDIYKVADVKVDTVGRRGTINLSLKSGTTVSFCNAGVSKLFPASSFAKYLEDERNGIL